MDSLKNVPEWGIERTIEYTRNMDFEQFQSDTKTVDAVVRNFEIIGEAAAHVPEEIVADHPEIPWQDMRDMRNVLAHEYFCSYPDSFLRDQNKPTKTPLRALRLSGLPSSIR